MKSKRIFAFALAMISLISVSSCSEKEKKNVEMSSSSSSEEISSIADRKPEVTSEADTNDTSEDSKTGESSAESKEESSEPEIISKKAGITFSDLQGQYEYSTGAGGWYTEFTLNADGTFEGDYHCHSFENDTEYADVCDFKGNFTMLEKIDDTTYSMRLERIDLINNVEPVSEEDYQPGDVRVNYTDYVQGLNSGKEFMVYLPGTNTDIFNDSTLANMCGFMYNSTEGTESLSFNVIYNKEEDAPFCSISD